MSIIQFIVLLIVLFILIFGALLAGYGAFWILNKLGFWKWWMKKMLTFKKKDILSNEKLQNTAIELYEKYPERAEAERALLLQNKYKLIDRIKIMFIYEEIEREMKGGDN